MSLNPIDTVVNFTAFGVLCLLVLHVFRHTIPRLVSHFEKVIERISAVFRDEAREQRQVFTEDLRLQRADFKAFLLQQHEEIAKLTKGVNDLTQRIEEKLAG